MLLKTLITKSSQHKNNQSKNSTVSILVIIQYLILGAVGSPLGAQKLGHIELHRNERYIITTNPNL